MEPFQYRPLEESSIRLVRRVPSTDMGDMSYELVHRMLPNDCERGGADFVALSYCWGNAKSTAKILLNGTPWTVTVSLYGALSAFELYHKDRTSGYYWIDALCINQADIEERNKQVYQMWRIYANARAVFVWLGEEDESTAAAFKLISDLTSWEQSWTYDRSGSRPPLELSVPSARQSEQEAKLAISEDVEEDWDKCDALSAWLDDLLGPNNHVDHPKSCDDALVLPDRKRLGYDALFDSDPNAVPAFISLCSRPYFTRAWVVLEYTQASHLELLCGKYYCTEPQFSSLLQTSEIRRVKGTAKEARDLSDARSQNIQDTESAALLFTAVLWQFASKQCSDPRDRIFACLGDRRVRAMESQDVVPLKPDYSMSAAEVAIHTTSYFDQLHAHFEEVSGTKGQRARTNLHPSAITEFFDHLSHALGIPYPEHAFYESVKSDVHWTMDSAGEDVLIAFGRPVAFVGEATRSLLHPDQEMHRRLDPPLQSRYRRS